MHEFDGRDNSEGHDCVGDMKLASGQCNSCLFYFHCKKNFCYERYICDGCYHCFQYEKASKKSLFRVITTKKESFRTVSQYLLIEIEQLLKESNFDERFGWLYNDYKQEMNNDRLLQ